MLIGARIIERLEEPVPYGDGVCKISGSIGITTTDMYDAVDIDRMISDADLALYASKHDGRATATVFDRKRHDGQVGDFDGALRA
ncbi:hypothetical protein GCM10022404_01300 [Celeribacter arenosi]|uniref:GGDEF domain-containing protein n=2 Tax=Celeribacter arenosi TaxID=792649 RepID=A0ABP7JSY8_9RHOB